MKKWHHRWRAPVVAVLVLGGLGALAVRRSVASDHQDTPEVELSPRMDINDVYAFPGSGTDRIALVMTTSSPLSPAQTATATFDPNLLYQLKIDNTGDAREDLVFQITFNGEGANQQVSVRGPVAPTSIGMRNSLLSTGPLVTGALNANLGSATGTQVFAGPRDDPFFIDLEQFFKILPDRRPATGPLSQPLTQQATSFRNPGIDFIAGFNTLAIVIELPESQLTGGGGGSGRIGVWGTISR
ncbi:MAG: DUF4331 family protein [Gemmatimonadaceae bacterium]